MQTEMQTKDNKTQNNPDISIEEFSNMILDAEQHLNGVSVETVWRKGKKFPVYKTNGGVRFTYVTQSKEDNPLYMLKTTDLEGKTTTDGDITRFKSVIAPLKEAGMCKAYMAANPETGNPALFLEMLPAPDNRDKGLSHWPAPDYTGLAKWQLHSATDKVLVDGYCLLINAAIRFKSIPYTKDGQERNDSKRGHAQHGLVQILADINGDNRRMSLKRSDGAGINPGFILTGRGNTPNTLDGEAHQMLVDSGIKGFPVAKPDKGNSWRRALDCNVRIRQYFVDLTIGADGLPTLVVMDA